MIVSHKSQFISKEAENTEHETDSTQHGNSWQQHANTDPAHTRPHPHSPDRGVRGGATGEVEVLVKEHPNVSVAGLHCNGEGCAAVLGEGRKVGVRWCDDLL